MSLAVAWSQNAHVADERRDRVLDWQEELQRITPRLSELPVAAQLTVSTVLVDFLREDVESISSGGPQDFPEAA